MTLTPDTPHAAVTLTPALSLVIPCFNEARSLPRLVERLREVLRHGDIEAVLVDNGSTDDTPDVLASLLRDDTQLSSLRVPVNLGYGHGILAGLRVARGNVLGWTHADLQTDPLDALRGLALFDAEPRTEMFVKGRRVGRPLADVSFTVAMSLFETLLLREALWDINAQPTLFTRSFFESWHEPPEDFSLDLFAFHAAKRAKLQVRRFPVRFEQRTHGASHWNVDARAKARFIRRTIQYSLRLRERVAGRP